jgi:nitrogen fixation protein FixH
MTPEFEAEYRRRQRARAKVTGWLLGALVILFFGIAIARIA